MFSAMQYFMKEIYHCIITDGLQSAKHKTAGNKYLAIRKIG